jgi:hypothetical protein
MQLLDLSTEMAAISKLVQEGSDDGSHVSNWWWCVPAKMGFTPGRVEVARKMVEGEGKKTIKNQINLGCEQK